MTSPTPQTLHRTVRLATGCGLLTLVTGITLLVLLGTAMLARGGHVAPHPEEAEAVSSRATPERMARRTGCRRSIGAAVLTWPAAGSARIGSDLLEGAACPPQAAGVI